MFNLDFNKILKKNKNKKALIDIYSGREITYAQLSERIKKIKKFILSYKIKQNDEVGSVLENSVENVEFFLSCCYLNLSYFPQSCEITKYELTNLLKNTNIKVFFVSNTTNSQTINFLKKKKIKIINIDNVDLRKVKNKNYSKKNRSSAKLIVNSSGTTGEPKKIVIDIERLWRSAKSFTKNYKFLNSKNVFYNILPMSYLGGLFNLGLIPLSLGATIVVDKQFSGNKFLTFWNKVKQYNIDILWLVPTILRGLLKLSKKIKMNYKNYKIFPKACFLGTATSYPQEKKNFEKKFKIKIFENYGTSETTFISLETLESKKFSRNNIGKILPNVKCRIKNNILHVKSPFIFKGYYENKKIKTHDIEKFYNTGDIIKIVDKKYLIFEGRKKEIIKKGGLLIVLQEINNVFQSIPRIEESYAMPVKHDFYGEDYVIFFTTKSKKVSSIKNSFRDLIPRYKWPKDIILIKKFKKTSSGKINIKNLKNLINNEK